jgi:hypothetical protein
LAALGSITVGFLALAPATILGARLATRSTARRSAYGLLAGVGLVALLIAYLQRDGPGTTCWHTATAAGCGQHLNPIPWLVVGIVLLVGSVLLQRRRGG